MSNTCSNCYSNCVEIISDKCVKYTGIDIETLNIKNGDSINYITSAISNFLISVLDASGIKYELDLDITCELINNELPISGEITQKDISNALASAICQLDSKITSLEAINDAENIPYSISCISGVTGNEGTHSVVQAVINELCRINSDLNALKLDVENNYVLVSDINTYISNYIINNPAESTGQKSKMVPYTVVEYYGPLNVFDASGAGTGEWEQIYLCNGENGTPDKRGRVGVGTTSGMGGGNFPSATDPAISGNPSYSLLTPGGSNSIVLTESQIPAHTHIPTVSVIDPGHTHTLFFNEYLSGISQDPGYDGGSNNYQQNVNKITSTTTTGISVNVQINSTGGGQGHSNVQPVLACYYIMYIPS